MIEAMQPKTDNILLDYISMCGALQCPALIVFFIFQTIDNLLSLFLPIELLGGSRKEHIAAAVEGGFDGILDYTDKKSVPSNLGTLS